MLKNLETIWELWWAFNFCFKSTRITGILQRTGNVGFYFCCICDRNISFTK